MPPDSQSTFLQEFEAAAIREVSIGYQSLELLDVATLNDDQIAIPAWLTERT